MSPERPATEDAPPAGLGHSLRRLADTALALLQTRLELLLAEVEEERLRLLQLLLWGAAALLFFGFSLVMLSFAVVVLFWDTHRLLSAVLLGLVYLAIAIGFAAGAHRRLQRPRLFSASMDELGKDREKLRAP